MQLKTDGRCALHNRQPCGLCLANRIAAARVRPYGPALEIAKQLRDGTYKKERLEPLPSTTP